MLTMGNMAGRDMDPCLDPRGLVNHVEGINYQDHMKKGFRTSHMALDGHDMWSGKRMNSNLLE